MFAGVMWWPARSTGCTTEATPTSRDCCAVLLWGYSCPLTDCPGASERTLATQAPGNPDDNDPGPDVGVTVVVGKVMIGQYGVGPA